jgi:hypothetical protein
VAFNESVKCHFGNCFLPETDTEAEMWYKVDTKLVRNWREVSTQLVRKYEHGYILHGWHEVGGCLPAEQEDPAEQDVGEPISFLVNRRTRLLVG